MDILELLNQIANAIYGRDVRQAIIDAIRQCYEDGKAGVNDLQARTLIESVMQVNEEQEAEIAVLTARIEELEGGGGGGSSSETTTTEVPTVIYDHGQINQIQVNNNSQVTRHVTFAKEFTEIPQVYLSWGKQTGGASAYSKITCCILYETLSTTGFDFFVSNTSGSQRSPSVTWAAVQETTVEIDTEIVVPGTEDLTPEQIANLKALFD